MCMSIIGMKEALPMHNISVPVRNRGNRARIVGMGEIDKLITKWPME